MRHWPGSLPRIWFIAATERMSASGASGGPVERLKLRRFADRQFCQKQSGGSWAGSGLAGFGGLTEKSCHCGRSLDQAEVVSSILTILIIVLPPPPPPSAPAPLPLSASPVQNPEIARASLRARGCTSG